MEFFKHNNYRNNNYLTWLRKQFCIVSKKPAECAHHVRLGTNGGKGLKPSDYFCIPLTNEFHTQGQMALHLIGEKTFFSKFKIEIENIFVNYLRLYLKETYGFISSNSFLSINEEILNLVNEIEMRRPSSAIGKKKIKISPLRKKEKNDSNKILQLKRSSKKKAPKISESEFYQKAKELKRIQDKETRKNIKENAPNVKNSFSSVKNNEFYQKAKEIKRKNDKEMREKHKQKNSEIRKEIYRRSKELKKEYNKNLDS